METELGFCSLKSKVDIFIILGGMASPVVVGIVFIVAKRNLQQQQAEQNEME